MIKGRARQIVFKRHLNLPITCSMRFLGGPQTFVGVEHQAILLAFLHDIGEIRNIYSTLQLLNSS